MIIDTEGNLLSAYMIRNGAIIKDPPFSICVDYNEEQKELFGEMYDLKQFLTDTDYKAIKYSDRAITEEEYAPVREQRANARKRINEIEDIFVPPTLSNDEIKEIEELFYQKHPRYRP